MREHVMAALDDAGIIVSVDKLAVEGEWHSRERVILIDERLDAIKRECVIVHEYVHLLLGHDGPQPDVVEEAVDVEAARILVSLTDYVAAINRIGPDDIGSLSRELRVTPRFVCAFDRGIGTGLGLPRLPSVAEPDVVKPCPALRVV